MMSLVSNLLHKRAQAELRSEEVPTDEVLSPRLRKLLVVVFALVALLAGNSAYLSSITFLGWMSGLTYQNYFYFLMVLLHLVLGFALIVPFWVFGVRHWRTAGHRPNRRAARMGKALFLVSLLVLASGVVLMRLEFLRIDDQTVRRVTYWLHVILPLVACWLFVLHRLER